MFRAFFVVLLLASGLRFTALTFDSLWLDESYQTVVESYGNPLPDLFNPLGNTFIYKPENPASIKSVLANFRKVDPLCPPLYAVLLNRWLTTFGGSDFTLRAFSVLCSILSITTTYFFGCSLINKRAGLYAAMLQAISPFDIAYAQEARMYSLCTLLATLSGGSLLLLCSKLRTSKTVLFALVYVFSTWALINTHYTQLFFWVFAIIVGFVVAILRKDLILAAFLVAANLCIAALSIPWLPLFIQAASVRTASFYVSRHASLFWPFWAFFIRIPFNWLVFLAGKKVMLWALPAYITSLSFIIYACKSPIEYFKLMTGKTKDDLELAMSASDFSVLLLFAWAIIPAAMIWLLDVIESHRVIEISRYLIGTAPAIFLLAGFALSLLSLKRVFIPLVTTHAAFCLANNAYLHLIPQKENWRAMAEVIEQSIQPGETLFVSNYYNILCLDRYIRKPLLQVGISPALGSSKIKNILETRAKSNSSTNFWVLSAQEGDAIFNIIPDKYGIIQQYNFPHALHLRQYKEI